MFGLEDLSWEERESDGKEKEPGEEDEHG